MQTRRISPDEAWTSDFIVLHADEDAMYKNAGKLIHGSLYGIDRTFSFVTLTSS